VHVTCRLEVTRGPRWLAELLYCSDTAGVFGALFIVLFIGIAVALHRVEMTDKLKSELMHNAGTVVSIALATIGAGKLGIGYVPTVASGVLFGYVAWSVFAWPRLR